MKKTLVAATRFEIAPTIQFLEEQEMDLSDRWEILITGVGSMLTTYALAKHLATSKPALMIQAGIAGSFSHLYGPGSVVMVEEESLGDLGVEEKGLFRDVFDMQFLSPEEFPFHEGKLKNAGLDCWINDAIPTVRGVTVNQVTTSPQRIEQLRNKYLCDIETMEGAAFHYVGLKENISILQLRAISNFVGERDKNNWQLRYSIERLNATLQEIILEHSL